MKLLIAIPALNEEDSIAQTIERALASRKKIIGKATPVEAVEITVVSDGSTDRTVELARLYEDQIRLIVFSENRGYGAAIQEAWRQSDADLLGFLDADGTCDPDFFADLCSTLFAEDADVVLGCRMHPRSRMPWVRRLGNRLFAALVSVFSSERVRDTASGMRVVRRSSLPKLLPLPGGLHFTPAMSARALLRRDVRIREIDMPYDERAGESKLRVGADGWRFLKVILETAFLYRPSRPLGIIGAVLFLIACGLMVTPVAYYLQHRAVQEWMIYRFVISHLLGSAAALLFSASYLTDKMVRIGLEPSYSAPAGRAERLVASRRFWWLPLLLAAAGVWLVIPSLIELVRTGATYEHWSRFIVMSFFVSCAGILVVTRAVDYVLDLLANQLRYLAGGKQQAETAARPAGSTEPAREAL